MAVALTNEEFRLWTEWLQEQFGLHFGPERREILRTRLEPRRAALGVNTFEQLLFHLKFHPEREQERELLIPHLTNNESYFFRERGSLDTIRDDVFPALCQQVDSGPVNLLSAACAAGEEAYTLAILAKETSCFASRPPRITAVDLDPRALERARCARYGEHAFRGTDATLRRQYFTAHGEQWEVLPELRSLVQFRQANLVDSEWTTGLPPQHLILCRNVMIYFDDDAIRRAADTLYQALAPGGYLFLGHADSLRRVPTRFEVERRPNAIFYRRPPEDG